MYNNFTNSISLYRRACKTIPEGVSSPGRKFSEVKAEPIYIAKAEGAYVFDVDNNKYIDFMNGLGPIILGHSYPSVYTAIYDQIKRGSVYGISCELEVELAEKIVKCCNSIEQIRFVCSGTEAVMSAVRLAKHHTSRGKILKFRESYHGHADSMLGNGMKVRDIKIGGVNDQIHENTIMCEYNDFEGFKVLIEDNKSDLAAVIIEPYSSNMGLVRPDEGFIELVYEYCNKHNVLLIFDEVVTGFRMRYGSVAEEFGVDPDLTIFGKIIGGGTPIGAYGGKEHIMKGLEEDDAFQGGDFCIQSTYNVSSIGNIGSSQ